MNRTWTVIFFLFLYAGAVASYIIMYYKYKMRESAIAIVSAIVAFITTGLIFIMPLGQEGTIIDEKLSKVTIESRAGGEYAVCDDGTEYRINSMNSSFMSGYNSFANDATHTDVKSEVTYRYDYKIWWFIPAHSTKKEINIYFDNEWFTGKYGCRLETNMKNGV